MTNKEKIRAEIERLMKKYRELVANSHGDEHEYFKGMCVVAEEMFLFIDSLQDEPIITNVNTEPIGIPVSAVELANIPDKKEPNIPDIVDAHWFEMLGEGSESEEPILDLIAKYLDHVSHEEAMKTKGAIDRWFAEYYPEPISEELEDAADKYSQSIHSDYSNDMFDSHNIYDAVIYGTNWQKERDEDEIRMIRELLDNFDKTCDEYHDAGFKHGQEALMKDAVDAKVIARWPLHSAPLYCSYEMYIPYAQHLSEGEKVKLIVIKEG